MAQLDRGTVSTCHLNLFLELFWRSLLGCDCLPVGLGLTCFCQVRNAAPAVLNLQARAYASDAKATPTEVSSILEQRIRGVQEESGLAETGRVLSVGYVEL